MIICAPNWWELDWDESGLTLFTHFCRWKFERSRMEIKFQFGGQYYSDRWGLFQKFGLLEQITFIPPSEIENFTKNVKNRLYENWEKFLDILKKM